MYWYVNISSSCHGNSMYLICFSLASMIILWSCFFSKLCTMYFRIWPIVTICRGLGMYQYLLYTHKAGGGILWIKLCRRPHIFLVIDLQATILFWFLLNLTGPSFEGGLATPCFWLSWSQNYWLMSPKCEKSSYRPQFFLDFF